MDAELTLKTLKNIENEFDSAFTSLLEKITQHQDICQIYSKKRDSLKLQQQQEEEEREENNQEASLEENAVLSHTATDSVYDEDYEQQEVTNEEDIHEITDEERSENEGSEYLEEGQEENEDQTIDEVDEDEFDNEDSSDKIEEPFSASLLDYVEPLLANIALSQAKLMTKAFLYSERCLKLEQKVHELEMDNFVLKNMLIDHDQPSRQAIIPPSYKPQKDAEHLDEIESNKISFNDQCMDNSYNVPYSSGLKLATDISKNVTNLMALKNAIDHRLEHQLMIETKAKEMSLMCHRYENTICGLNLVISYLKKELSGRVQQIQLLINGSPKNGQTQGDVEDNEEYDEYQDNESDDDEEEEEQNKLKTKQLILDEQYIKIWNQIVFEIALNRYKTLSRLAEISHQMDIIEKQRQMLHQQNNQREEVEKNEDKQMIYLRSTLLKAGTPVGLTPKISQENVMKMGQINFFNIYMDESRKSLGLQIMGGGDDQTPLMVWKIFPGSLAEETGYFCPGDIILSIQTVDMVGKSRDDALRLIQSIKNGWFRISVLRIPLKKIQQELEQYTFEILSDNDNEGGDTHTDEQQEDGQKCNEKIVKNPMYIYNWSMLLPYDTNE